MSQWRPADYSPWRRHPEKRARRILAPASSLVMSSIANFGKFAERILIIQSLLAGPPIQFESEEMSSEIATEDRLGVEARRQGDRGLQ
ncbi:MAG: hypothetical protein WCA91_05280, partial [Candidatus Acidiferrales bacterium]